MGEGWVSDGDWDGGRTVRAAIVGTGNIAGRTWRRCVGWAGGPEVVAAVDVDGARAGAFCTEHGIPKSYEDTEEMLAGGPGSRPHLYAPAVASLSVLCMEAGAWVLCEKPRVRRWRRWMSSRLPERATGKFCSSVYQWRFGSGART